MRFVALVALLFLSGCLESTIEDGRVFTVETLNRVEDAGAIYSMKDNLSQGPVLVLFRAFQNISIGYTVRDLSLNFLNIRLDDQHNLDFYSRGHKL